MLGYTKSEKTGLSDFDNYQRCIIPLSCIEWVRFRLALNLPVLIYHFKTPCPYSFIPPSENENNWNKNIVLKTPTFI